MKVTLSGNAKLTSEIHWQFSKDGTVTFVCDKGELVTINLHTQKYTHTGAPFPHDDLKEDKNAKYTVYNEEIPIDDINNYKAAGNTLGEEQNVRINTITFVCPQSTTPNALGDFDYWKCSVEIIKVTTFDLSKITTEKDETTGQIRQTGVTGKESFTDDTDKYKKKYTNDLWEKYKWYIIGIIIAVIIAIIILFLYLKGYIFHSSKPSGVTA